MEEQEEELHLAFSTRKERKKKPLYQFHPRVSHSRSEDGGGGLRRVNQKKKIKVARKSLVWIWIFLGKLLIANLIWPPKKRGASF